MQRYLRNAPRLPDRSSRQRQARVAERDAVAVATQVVDHRLRVGDTGLGIDHPVARHQGIEHILHLCLAADARQFTRLNGLAQQVDHPPPKVARQRPDRLCQRLAAIAVRESDHLNQIVSGCTMAITAEAVLFARRAGVDATRLTEALAGGFAGTLPPGTRLTWSGASRTWLPVSVPRRLTFFSGNFGASGPKLSPS